jgi:alpha-beta hydrolase superfamily lysophospholipase
MLASATAASGVGYLVTAYTVSRWLTRRSRSRPRPQAAQGGITWEPIECHTRDGYRLAGWIVTPAEVRGTVALFHGLRQSRSQMLPRIALLTAAGYRCVAFDHRAHGQSVGRMSSFGFFESQDVCSVLNLIDERWPESPRAALGISMGAAALCFAGARVRSLGACILESVYHDIASAFDNRIGSKFPSWFRRFTPGVIWVTERRLGLKLAQITPADHIAEMAPVPLLLVTGSDDPHAPPADAKRLVARCAGPCQLAQIAGADHTNLCEKGGDGFRRLLVDFLDRHLQRSGQSSVVSGQ